MLEVIFERVTPDEEEAEDQDDRQEAEAEHDPLGERELPPTLVQPMRGARSFSGHGARYETESWRSDKLSGWQPEKASQPQVKIARPNAIQLPGGRHVPVRLLASFPELFH